MNIGIILVTYNRLAKLKKARSGYERQNKKIDKIIIVDNCSTDGTTDFLSTYKKQKHNYKVIVLTMSKNLGGAGGFYEGMKRAIQENIEWAYLSDDDAYVNDTTLSELEKVYSNIQEKNQISALCSVVKNKSGIDFGHRQIIKKNPIIVRWKHVNQKEYGRPYFDIDIFSYVGTAIRVERLLEVGLDRKNYFIYHDDQDHSIRIRNTGRILTCTKSIIYHDTEPTKYKQLFWGNYYDTRNKLLTIRYNFPIRYYRVRYIIGFLKDCILCKNRTKRKLLKAAYLDAKHQKTGISDIYNPEWKA